MYPDQQQPIQPAPAPAPFDINTNPYNVPKQPEKDNSKTKKIAIGAIIGVALLLFLPLLFLMGGSSNDAKEQKIENVISESQAPSLDPATTIMLNQATASMSQDLSTIDDAADFSEQNLADKSLGL